MKINSKKYQLTPSNYYKIETDKTQIVIGSTFSNNMNHFIGWEKRLNGNFKKTAHYTIDVNGNVFEHFNPKYYSKFISNDNFDRQIISIVIENEGWLLKDVEKNEFIDCGCNIYNSRIFEKKWRNFNYWTPYNNKQIKSLIMLIKDICDRFKSIPLEVVPHNTKIDVGLDKYKGILYRSNFNGVSTDPNPSLDFELIKNEIEIYKTIEENE